MNQINQYPVEATEITKDDYLDIDKHIGGGAYESQKVAGNVVASALESGTYDSGWKVVPEWNGSYGLAPINIAGLGTSAMSIRILNRTVHLQGRFVLPLSSTVDGLNLVTDLFTYNNSPNREKPYLYQGTNGGFTKQTNGVIITNSPILPPALRPNRDTVVMEGDLILRSISLTGSDRYLLQSFINTGTITVNGDFFFSSTEQLQGNGNVSLGMRSELDLLNSRFLATDFVPDFSGSRSGFAGAVNTREPVASTLQAEIDIDARDGLQLGGFVVNINRTYDLSSVTLLQTIKDEFNAL